MFISVAFSVTVYKISSAEINRGLNRQTQFFSNFPDELLPARMKQLEQNRESQVTDSANRLKGNLFYFNLLILLLSTLSSYLFAKKTLQPIEDMVESQNRFTADASHELRTPLTAMRSEIEVTLRDPKLKLAEAKQLMASNLDEISKLESLSSALLRLAKYQEQVKTEFKKVELTNAVTEAYEKVQHLADKKQIEFNNEFVDVAVLGDKASLVELFVILLDNAIKYSPEKSTISINISQDEKTANVAVKDQGYGIKQSDLPLIFNRFFRSDNSRAKTKIDGYGLGLSIAKNIVDLHDGEITASSVIGEGSTFTVTLPIE
jgi:signal transduction histidine kinase